MNNSKRIKSTDLKGKRLAIGQVTFTSIRAYHMLEKDGVHVDMFFDRNFVLQHEKYKSTPIFPWANFYDTYVILTTQSRYDELTAFLINSYGYDDDHIILLENIEFNCNEITVKDEYDWNWIYNNVANAADGFIRYKLQLFDALYPDDSALNPYISILINNKCTLNCKDCFTYMPYYKKCERRNFDVNRIIEDFDRILDAVDYIKNIEIYGGEPLLHPELHKLIEYFNTPKAQSKIAHAFITTNGTLTFSNESLEALKGNSLYWRVMISPYGELSKKQYELFSQLNEAGIPYTPVFITSWKKFSNVIDPPLTGKEQIIDNCKKCGCVRTFYVDGSFYRCAGTACLAELKRIPYDEHNVFNCSKPFTKSELKDFSNSISPAMAYCSGFTYDIPIAEQAEDTISYKRYE